MRILWKLGLLVTLAALFVATPDDTHARDKDEKPEDPFILIKTAGRKWTLKRVPKPGNEGGDTETTYHDFEVMNVYEDKAEVAQQTLDASKKPTDDQPFVFKIKFDLEEGFFADPLGYNKAKIETVKTDAGKFKCVKWTKVSGHDGDVTLWKSIDFPGLTVKQDDRFGMREIVDFTWVEGDPGHEADDDDDDEEIDPKKLYTSKRTRWILKTTFTKGPRNVRSFEVVQYEVKKVEDEQCELEVTQMTQLLKPMKGVDEEIRIIKFDDVFEETYLQPGIRATKERTERRITEVGLFECTVWSYRDDEGRDATAWYANKWPGLIVRRVVEGKEYKAVTEIVEFED
jgi:hypothetical protein